MMVQCYVYSVEWSIQVQHMISTVISRPFIYITAKLIGKQGMPLSLVSESMVLDGRIDKLPLAIREVILITMKLRET